MIGIQGDVPNPRSAGERLLDRTSILRADTLVPSQKPLLCYSLANLFNIPVVGRLSDALANSQ
jgi:hypothetical protein